MKREKECSGGEGGGICSLCNGVELLYWCEVCRQAVSEKRCPLCGLKCRKMREPCATGGRSPRG